MKAIKIITHPYILIISFFMIMVSGKHMGGFYLLYLLSALPYWGIHALLAFLGTVLLVFSYYKYQRRKAYHIESILNIAGTFLLLFSLVLFFYNDKEHYNYRTFYQVVPQISLVLFGLITLAFLYDNIISIVKKPGIATSDVPHKS